MSVELESVKGDVAVANRLLTEFGLASGVRASLGHASMRVPGEPDKFVVKGRGYRIDELSRMRPEDMVVCDLEGNWLDGPAGSLQCHEVKIHSCIYGKRPDVQSVVHVHPKFTVLLSVLGKTLVPMAQEGIRFNDGQTVQKPLPVYPHTKTVVTEEEGQEVAGLLDAGSAVLLLGHGAVTVGKDLEQAVMIMVHLEHQAEYNYYALLAAGRDHPHIPEKNVEHMAQPSMTEPHFQSRLAAMGGRRGGGNLWDVMSQRVWEDL